MKRNIGLLLGSDANRMAVNARSQGVDVMSRCTLCGMGDGSGATGNK